MKKTFVLAAICVAGLAYHMAIQDSLPTREVKSKGTDAPKAIVEAPAPAPGFAESAPALVSAPESAPLSVTIPTAVPVQSRHEQADKRFAVKHDIKFLENLRRIPDADPLVDEIVEYLKNDHGDQQLLSNELMRAKWTKLMDLVAAHPEVKQ